MPGYPGDSLDIENAVRWYSPALLPCGDVLAVVGRVQLRSQGRWATRYFKDFFDKIRVHGDTIHDIKSVAKENLTCH